MLLASQKTFLRRAAAPFARHPMMHPYMLQRRVFSSQSMSVEDINQQKVEFDHLKKELFELKEKQVTILNSRGKEEQADAETLIPP